MSSSIKLKNANGKTVSVTNSNANQTDKEVIYLNTVDELANASGSINAVAIVSDLSRGGTFEWSVTGTANGGTVFAGVSGYWNRQYSGAVNVLWFGAKGDWNGSIGTDDTVSIQNAINFSGYVYIPDGNYLITNIIFNSNGGIYGESRQNTILISDTLSTLPAICDKGTNLIFKDFTLQSKTLGVGFGFAPYSLSTWTGNDSSLYQNLLIKNFEFGMREQRTVFNKYLDLQFRQNKYSLNFSQNSGTPPFVWNNTGANGWFNNNLYFNNLLLDGNNNGYCAKIIGDNVTIDGVQCSNYLTYGLLLGDSNYNTLGNYIINNFYEEFATTVSTDNAIYGYGSSFTLTNIDINSSLANAMSFVSSKSLITNIKSNASPTNLIISNNSYVEVKGKLHGYYITVFTLSGTGYVKESLLDITKFASTTLAFGTSYDITLNGKSGQYYAFDVFGSDNGTNFGIRVIMSSSQVYVIGNKPSNLTVATFVNGNGLRDIRFSNTAGSAYNIVLTAIYNPIYYTVTL